MPHLHETPRWQVGESLVMIDFNTTAPLANGMREFIYRVKRLGAVSTYRVEVPDADVTGLSRQELAEYLMLKVRQKSRLFSYREP